ncbi:14313_t:CDS:2, partial [Rhizophagus irregularis]
KPQDAPESQIRQISRALGADLRLFIERAIICDLSILSRFTSH